MIYERHFFVCQNHRLAGKSCCFNRGASEILAALKEGLRARPELKSKVRVTLSGCLNECELGPTIVVYPEGACYVGVTLADVPEIITSHMEQGIPVARLLKKPN